MDAGHLHAEYMSCILYRYKASTVSRVSPGKRKIEVKMVWEKPEKSKLIPAGNVSLAVDGVVVAGAHVEIGMRSFFDPSETFDVGMDLGAPASFDYFDRVPFAF